MARERTPTHAIRSPFAADAKLVERLRKMCLAPPEANERVSHGERTWFAGKGKVFPMLDNIITARRTCRPGFRSRSVFKRL